ncbi:hypothetical protein OIU77_008740 [Salix suchowensis]|uniref:CASP-like protein n=1 Tax=Salix suchowensis TaxID=1278906 RepID=A0ABQ9AC63_9ROSI|nr:hypothetical protein OIU77_008740 [Salix suchowensis]
MEKRDKGSSPMAMMGSGDENEDVKTTMRTAETLLRLVPMALCVSALVVMLKNSQTNDFGSLSYSDLGAFRYLRGLFFLLDQLLTYVILAAGTVSTEVLYLASKGDTTITWSEACVSFGGFCHRALISTVITFAVVICYAVLSLLSSYNLFSKYDSPVLTYPGKGIEVATLHG